MQKVGTPHGLSGALLMFLVPDVPRCKDSRTHLAACSFVLDGGKGSGVRQETSLIPEDPRIK